MRLPVIEGLIRRRLLLNFRVEPEVVARLLPAPFRPKLQAGFALAGICLIRLEEIRPAGLPRFLGLASENAAHRIAVLRDGPAGMEESVYIPRRDNSSRLNAFAGGRLFPGEHHLAEFRVDDRGARIGMDLRSCDGHMALHLRAEASESWPAGSCFASLNEASRFFETGKVGYSVTRRADRLDGVRLEIAHWAVRPLAVREAQSSFFADPARFPPGSVTFDHALIMRDVPHRWHGVESVTCCAA